MALQHFFGTTCSYSWKSLELLCTSIIQPLPCFIMGMISPGQSSFLHMFTVSSRTWSRRSVWRQRPDLNDWSMSRREILPPEPWISAAPPDRLWSAVSLVNALLFQSQMFADWTEIFRFLFWYHSKGAENKDLNIIIYKLFQNHASFSFQFTFMHYLFCNIKCRLNV